MSASHTVRVQTCCMHSHFSSLAEQCFALIPLDDSRQDRSYIPRSLEPRFLSYKSHQPTCIPFLNKNLENRLRDAMVIPKVLRLPKCDLGNTKVNASMSSRSSSAGVCQDLAVKRQLSGMVQDVGRSTHIAQRKLDYHAQLDDYKLIRHGRFPKGWMKNEAHCPQ